MSARPATLGLRAHDRHASELIVDAEDAAAAECPRGTARSHWSVLEVLGAGALVAGWLWLLWRGVALLAGA